MIMDINIKKLLSHLKQSAKKRDLEFSLTEYDLMDLSYPINCPILNMPIDYITKGYHPHKPSVDRIDSSKGYIPDNIQIISFVANRAKNSLTDKELNQMAKYYI